MGPWRSYFKLLLLVLATVACACNIKPAGELIALNRLPLISPDYNGVTIPPNLAPVNLKVEEPGSYYFAELSSGINTPIRISSRKGSLKVNDRDWKGLMKEAAGSPVTLKIYVKTKEGWNSFNEITYRVAEEPIDKYLSYRLLYPGYESWNELSIEQRDLEGFREKPIINNRVADDNCVNCHSYNNAGNDFLFHMRGSVGGTYFYSGSELKKVNIKIPEMKNGAVYPRWHPSGRYVAFSSNKVIQQFHASDNKKIEVMDLESSLLIYDIQKNEVTPLNFPNQGSFMDTYPEWSPDGRKLWFCRAAQIRDTFDYRQIRYNLYKTDFDPETLSYGEPVLVVDAASTGKSISFPRISPDGRFMVFTMQDYGCFPIWHKETDLYIAALDSMHFRKMELNSDFSESYHSWSSNSRWLVFSSKRGDGLTARPYFSYIDINGTASLPFILPQKDPSFYDNFLKTYNVPELSVRKIWFGPGELRKVSRTDQIQAVSSEDAGIGNK